MKSISFIRWGNLNPVKHKEHSKKEDFHVAPKKKGIYAFPCGYVERFLIWGSYTDHWNHYILDDNGKKIKNDGNSSLSDSDFKKLLKKKAWMELKTLTILTKQMKKKKQKQKKVKDNELIRVIQ